MNAASDGRSVEDCWNTIGIRGDSSCPKLVQHVHCRNCPAYAAAAVTFLRRDLPDGYLSDRTRHLAQQHEAEERGTHAVVIFRVADEWFALSMLALDEVAEPRPVHSLPHQKSGTVLGLVNVRGELVICISLARLLGLKTSAEASRANGTTACPRLLVVSHGGQRVTFPVDDMGGLYRYHPRELGALPATVAKSASPFTKSILPWNSCAVGLLDEQRLMPVMNRSIA